MTISSAHRKANEARRDAEAAIRRGLTDRSTALQARFQAEREGIAQAGVEVVVLSAESADAIRLTHGRYFKTIGQLARG